MTNILPIKVQSLNDNLWLFFVYVNVSITKTLPWKCFLLSIMMYLTLKSVHNYNKCTFVFTYIFTNSYHNSIWDWDPYVCWLPLSIKKNFLGNSLFPLMLYSGVFMFISRDLACHSQIMCITLSRKYRRWISALMPNNRGSSMITLSARTVTVSRHSNWLYPWNNHYEGSFCLRW